MPFNPEQMTADAEYLLTQWKPGFDLTSDERSIAREHAERMCCVLSGCPGDARGVVHALMGINGITMEALRAFREQAAAECPGSSPTPWAAVERDAKIDEFDALFGMQRRREIIQQAVHAACLVALDEAERASASWKTVAHGAGASILAAVRRVVAWRPWRRRSSGSE